MSVNRGGRGGDVLEDGCTGARVSGGVREKAWAHPGGTFTVHSNRKIRRKGPGREEIWAQCTHRGAPCIDLCGVICVGRVFPSEGLSRTVVVLVRLRRQRRSQADGRSSAEICENIEWRRTACGLPNVMISLRDGRILEAILETLVEVSGMTRRWWTRRAWKCTLRRRGIAPGGSSEEREIGNAMVYTSCYLHYGLYADRESSG